jgi:stearoyl-CoA 9-desaturase NADPH oxidoreductase
VSMSPVLPPPTAPRSVRRRLATRLGPLPTPARRLLDNPLLAGLATPHGLSRYLEALHPLWTLEGGRAVVTEATAETPDTVTLTLRPDHRWVGFAAGQHVRLGVVIDGVVRARTYSVSSSQHRDDGRFTVTVKRKESGLVSRHLTTAVGPGEVLHVGPPAGEVVLPDPRPPRLLLVSGGSGITPVASMLRTLADEHHRGAVTFLHYTRTADELPFAPELRSIAARLPAVDLVVVPTGSTGPGVGGRHRGRCTAEQLATIVPDHLERLTFACGPSGLIDTLEDVYVRAGAADRLRVERFTPPALRTSDGPGDGTIRFDTSDVTVVDDGRSILEQAEAAGLAPRHGCRMGICHTCTARKPAGSVLDLRSGRRSNAPDEDVQICVNVPAGDVVLDL